jgi:hypothetical protein
MPAKRIDQHWADRINELAANDPKPGPYRIEAQLAEEASVNPSLPAPPTANTIRRYLVRFDKKSKEEKDQYLYFRWPQSMEAGLLPWEASAAALELLGVAQRFDTFARLMEAQVPDEELVKRGGSARMGRPSVRLVRWYWRITQTAPDLPKDMIDQRQQGVSLEQVTPSRYDIAQTLAAWEAAGIDAPQRFRDAIEGYLAFAPWRSRSHADEYKMAVDLGGIPGLTLEHMRRANWVAVRQHPFSFRIEAMREVYGEAFAERMAAHAADIEQKLASLRQSNEE